MIVKSHQEIIDKIFKLIGEGGNLTILLNKLIRFLGHIGIDELKYYLAISGIIPEEIKHDSSEEKLYSKYCEFLGFYFFKIMGFNANLINVRSGKADVIAEKKGANSYRIVADTKAARLSRTALNVKDYKIDSLGTTWRIKEEAEYSVLFNPYGFFLKKNSQLYSKAIKNNVTMMSYTHLIAILSIPGIEGKDLTPLWNHGKSLQDLSVLQKKNAKIYWDKLDLILFNLGLNKTIWETCKKNAADQLKVIINEEVSNIERKEQEIMNMDIEILRKEVKRLEKFEKIKISILKKKDIIRLLEVE